MLGWSIPDGISLIPWRLVPSAFDIFVNEFPPNVGCGVACLGPFVVPKIQEISLVRIDDDVVAHRPNILDVVLEVLVSYLLPKLRITYALSFRATFCTISLQINGYSRSICCDPSVEGVPVSTSECLSINSEKARPYDFLVHGHGLDE